MKKEVEFFDKTSEKYLAEYEKNTPEGYSFRVRREKVLALAPETKNEKKALDIGCGPGVMVDELLEKGYRINCVDASPEMINLTNKKYGSDDRIEASVGNVYKLDFPDNCFDLVTAMGLLEYLDDQEKAMKEINRVTKKDGIIIITFPNKTSPWRTFNRATLFVLAPLLKTYKSVFKKPPYPIRHREYSAKKTADFLKKFGLETEKIVFYNFKFVPHPFDKIFPRFTVWQSKIFEKLDGTFFKFVGTGFILKARRQSPPTNE